MSEIDTSQTDSFDLETALIAIRRDYAKLAPRIRQLEHSVTCECNGVTLRVHFPSLRQGKATVHELVETVFHFLAPFALPRTQVLAVDQLYGKVDVDEFKLRTAQLSESARSLFKRAHEATNRNGEAGELLLYLLTEWALEAPQLIAKMCLKTNREMPVHGADGVHVRFCAETSRLLLYWGEAKFYGDVGQGIGAAVKSIAEALDPEKMKHELDLVQRNIDFAGLAAPAKAALLRYLDPYDEAYNARHDITTCLVGFDFDAFDAVSLTDAESEATFAALAKAKLVELSETIAASLKTAGLASHKIELFLFPLPSVQDLRDLFQAKIGWKQ